MPRIDPLEAKFKLTGAKAAEDAIKRITAAIRSLNDSLKGATAGAGLTKTTQGIADVGNAAKRSTRQFADFSKSVVEGELKMSAALQRLHRLQERFQARGTIEAESIIGASNRRLETDAKKAAELLSRWHKTQEDFLQKQATFQARGVAEAESIIGASNRRLETDIEGAAKLLSRWHRIQEDFQQRNQEIIRKATQATIKEQDQQLKRAAASFEAQQREILASRQRFLDKFEAVRRGRPGTADVGTQRRVQRFEAEEANRAAQAFQRMGQAAKRAEGPIGQIASFFGRIALFTVAASVITRAFFAIGQAIGSSVGLSINFNSTLEQGRLAIAGILASTREVRDTSGQLLEPAEAYVFLLTRASNLQREVLLRSISTLGTAEELADVFQRILGLSADQKATDEDRLDLAQNILNAGKLLGLNGEQLAVEARQLLTLETNRGQLILQSLGISRKQLIAFREQGTLIEKLNEHLAAFSSLAEDAAGSFVGLTTSVETVFKLIAGATFEDIFRGLKDILTGVRDELRRIEQEGGLQVLLGLTKQQLEDLGKTLTQVAVAGFVKLAEAIAAVTRFFAENQRGVEILAHAMATLWKAVELAGEAFGFLVSVHQSVTSFFFSLAEAVGLSTNQINELKEALEALLRILTTGAGGAILGALIGGTVGFFGGPLTAGAGAGIGFTAGLIKGLIDVVQDLNAEAGRSSNVRQLQEDLAKLGQEIIAFGNQKIGPNNTITDIKKQADALRDRIAELKIEIAQELPPSLQKGATQALNQLATALGEAQGEFVKLGQRTTEAGDEADKIAKKFAAFREEVDKLAFSLQQAFAGEIGDLDLSERVGLAEIEAERLNNIKNQAGAIVDIERKAALQRLELRHDLAKKSIEIEQEAHQKLIDEIERAADAQNAIADAADTERQANISLLQTQLQIAQEMGASLKDQVDLQKQINALSIEAAKAALENVERQIKKTEELIAVSALRIEAIKKEIEAQLLLAEALGEDSPEQLQKLANIADRIKLLDEEIKKIGELKNELKRLQGEQKGAAANIKIAEQQAAQSMRNLTTTTINLGDTIRESIGGAFDALIAGTLDLEDAFKSFALGIGKKFADALTSMITDKLGFDLTFQRNVAGLSGGFSGAIAGIGNSFSSLLGGMGIDLQGALTGFQQAFGGAFSSIFSGAQFSATSFFNSLSVGFENLGVLGSGALGAGLSRGLGSLLGLGGTSGIGATVGGIGGAVVGSFFGSPQIGAFVGSFFGDIAESIFGSLFKHTPTKGTQIRKGTIEFLRDLNVIFSREFDKDDFFHGGTKKLANRLNISFLEASRLAISEFRPSLHASGLTDDLRALGIFLTRDAADAVGKDLEQAAITFGNLVANNLQDDVEAVQAFIDDTVEKTGVTLGGLLHVMAQDFKDARISVELFEQGVRGAFNIFDDIAPNIDITAFREAATFLPEHGGFNVDRFEDLIEGAVGATEVLGRATVDAITEGINEGFTDAVDYEALFRRNVLNSFRDVIAQGFIDGVIQGMLISPALAFAFSEFDRIIADFVAGTITQDIFRQQMNVALEAVRPQLEIWAEAVGIAGETLFDFLSTSLPIVGDINDSVNDTANNVARTARELQNIADSLRRAAQDLLTGPNSPLTKRQKFELKLTEFEELAARARGGDLEAAQELASVGNELVQLARDVFKSSDRFEEIFQMVHDTFLEVADLLDQNINLTSTGSDTTGAGDSAGDSLGVDDIEDVMRTPSRVLEDILIEAQAIHRVLELSTGIVVGGVPRNTGTGAQGTPQQEAEAAVSRAVRVLDAARELLNTQFQEQEGSGLNTFGDQAERANIRRALLTEVDDTTETINDLIADILAQDPNANVAGLQQWLADLNDAVDILRGGADIGNVALAHVLDSVALALANLNTELANLGQGDIINSDTTTTEPPPAVDLVDIFTDMREGIDEVNVNLLALPQAFTDHLSDIFLSRLEPLEELPEIQSLLARMAVAQEHASGGVTQLVALFHTLLSGSFAGPVQQAQVATMMQMQAQQGVAVNAAMDTHLLARQMEMFQGLLVEGRTDSDLVPFGRESSFDDTALIEELQSLREEVSILTEVTASGATARGQTIQVEGEVMVDGQRMGRFVTNRINDGLRRNEVLVPERALTRR